MVTELQSLRISEKMFTLSILLLRAPDGVTIGKLFVVIVAPLPRARVVANLAGNLEFIDNQPGLN